MPYGLPSATVCTSGATVTIIDAAKHLAIGKTDIVAGQHLEILHAGADQDGWNGYIICKYPRNADQCIAIPRYFMRL